MANQINSERKVKRSLGTYNRYPYIAPKTSRERPENVLGTSRIDLPGTFPGRQIRTSPRLWNRIFRGRSGDQNLPAGLLVYLQQENGKKSKKLMKIVNIDKENLHIFRATWRISIKLSRKRYLMITANSKFSSRQLLLMRLSKWDTYCLLWRKKLETTTNCVLFWEYDISLRMYLT